MATRPVPIRFTDEHWSALQEEAQELGITAAEFVRSSSLFYIGFCRARRGGVHADDVDELMATARRAVLSDPRYMVG